VEAAMSAIHYPTVNRPLDAELERERWLDEIGSYARSCMFDDGPEPDTTCEQCGFEWNCGLIRATRWQPAEARFPDCPACGS
jgi:hypothetical protein